MMTETKRASKYTGFEDFDDMRRQFVGYNGILSSIDVKPSEVLLAVYIQESYEGAAFVLYRRNGVLYEVNGSHCSCYGLEGQWKPEETSWAALLMRNKDYVLRYGTYERIQKMAARATRLAAQKETICG